MSQAPIMSPPELPMLEDPPKWPKVVGIFSIVWGSLWLVCGGCGLASSLLSPMLMKMAEKSMPPDAGPMPSVLMPSKPQMVLMVVSVGLALLLLFAGIATVSRRAQGRTMHLVYGVLSILNTAPAVFFGYQQIQAQVAWAAANQGSVWAQRMHPEFGYVALAVSVVLGIAWPLFCLVWFATHRPEVGAPTPDLV
jgi:hypothetical protein